MINIINMEKITMLTQEIITQILIDKNLLTNYDFKIPYASCIQYKSDLYQITEEILKSAKDDFIHKTHWNSYEEKEKEQFFADAADNIPIKTKDKLILLKKYYDDNWLTNISDLGMIIAALINENQLYFVKNILDTI